jgi:hypothetical protein
MKSLITIMLILIFTIPVNAQEKIDSVYETGALMQLMALLNLEFDDIGFRPDYTEPDSFRLWAVADLMKQPYGMVSYTSYWAELCTSGNLETILNKALEDLRRENVEPELSINYGPDKSLDFSGINLFYSSLELNRLLMKVYEILYESWPKAYNSTFAALTEKEKRFLGNQFIEIILEDTATVNLPVEVIDSLSELEEDYVELFVEFGFKIEKEHLLSAGIDAAVEVYDEIERLLEDVTLDEGSISELLSNTGVIPPRVDMKYYLGKHPRWGIGGTGDDRYIGEYDFILDFGGNDFYELSYDPSDPHGTIIIDLAGDDIYTARDDFVIGAGCMSIGLLYDWSGDDIYHGQNFSLGSGFLGLGLLYDRGGSDKYSGDTHTQGAGTFGIGLLVDRGGADQYEGRLFAQGVGLPEGFGMIVDDNGNDNYFSGGKYPEGLGLAGDDTHYMSLSQGFGYGWRPYLSGGIGAIVDLAGKDNYVTDIYGQGASYWWSLGMIYDAGGYDQYISHQYAQGTGVHMSLGILLDERGNDFYRGKGLMQGVGHDYACGIILDRRGDDIYQAGDLSQAAGSANGIGIVIDNRGDDAYYIIGEHNTHGYGNPRRDFGSMGLFLDLAGHDRYTGAGDNNIIWKTDSKWGGGYDMEFIVADSAATGDK